MKTSTDGTIHIPAGLLLEDGVKVFIKNDIGGGVIPGTRDDADEVIHRLAENEARSEAGEEDDINELTEAEEEEDAWRVATIRRGSPIAILLEAWYDEHGLSIEDSLRSAVTTENAIYFVVGIGYNVIDRDMLGGDGSGDSVKEFEDMAAKRTVIGH